MKKVLLGLVIALSLVACGDKAETPKENTKPVVKIGVVLPLTGANSYMGKQMQEGYGFVREYLNPDIDYELVYFDDQQSSAKAAVGVKKLIDVDKVDVLLTGTSQTAAIAADAAQNAKIIHLGMSSDNRFTEKDYNYTMAPAAQDETAVLLKHMQDMGYRKIALLTANEMYGNLVEENVNKLAENYGMQVVFNEKFNLGSTDYRILLHKAAQANPDIYFIETWPPEIDILTKQLLEISPNAKITSQYAFFISSNPELYKGRFCLNVGSNDEVFKKAFYQKYSKKLEQMSATSYAQLALILDILSNKDKDINETIENNKSIFGKLTLDGRSIRYLPIVEVVE
ncbi:MAG: hypothetical protein E7018_00980 [Alphaproteobacteria bacterium]|nr:hypothetical protein [Alphaproteobacteria bacterium]